MKINVQRATTVYADVRKRRIAIDDKVEVEKEMDLGRRAQSQSERGSTSALFGASGDYNTRKSSPSKRVKRFSFSTLSSHLHFVVSTLSSYF